jgi:hypothetical protein
MSHYENLFSSQQFGFRPHHRTTDNLFILKTLISKYVLKKKTKIFSFDTEVATELYLIISLVIRSGPALFWF